MCCSCEYVSHQCMSRRKRWFPPVRLSPTPPAQRETSITFGRKHRNTDPYLYSLTICLMLHRSKSSYEDWFLAVLKETGNPYLWSFGVSVEFFHQVHAVFGVDSPIYDTVSQAHALQMNCHDAQHAGPLGHDHAAHYQRERTSCALQHCSDYLHLQTITWSSPADEHFHETWVTPSAEEDCVTLLRAPINLLSLIWL